MAYEATDFGPGDIAALPPTIGLTSRAPTIGAELPGRPIPPVGNCGVGTENGLDGMALPLGLLAGGALLLWYFTRDQEMALARY